MRCCATFKVQEPQWFFDHYFFTSEEAELRRDNCPITCTRNLQPPLCRRVVVVNHTVVRCSLLVVYHVVVVKLFVDSLFLSGGINPPARPHVTLSL